MVQIKKKFKSLLLLALIWLSMSSVSDARKNKRKPKQIDGKVMLITIPKSGTHLLEKCLHFLDAERLNYAYNETFKFDERWDRNKQNSQTPPDHWRGNLYPTEIPRIVEQIKRALGKPERAYKAHMYYSEAFDTALDENKCQKILLLRDPRSVLVSLANMIKPGFEPEHTVDFNDLLLDLIDGRQQHFIAWGSSRHTAYPFIWEVGISSFYKHYLPFMGTKNCLTVRFEHLVGAAGGGSKELQEKAVGEIAAHVGVELTPEVLSFIQENLFGNTATFNQGTINGWKKYFTPEVKEAYKAVPGANQLLIELGYEHDELW